MSSAEAAASFDRYGSTAAGVLNLLLFVVLVYQLINHYNWAKSSYRSLHVFAMLALFFNFVVCPVRAVAAWYPDFGVPCRWITFSTASLWQCSKLFLYLYFVERYVVAFANTPYQSNRLSIRIATAVIILQTLLVEVLMTIYWNGQQHFNPRRCTGDPAFWIPIWFTMWDLVISVGLTWRFLKHLQWVVMQEFKPIAPRRQSTSSNKQKRGSEVSEEAFSKSDLASSASDGHVRMPESPTSIANANATSVAAAQHRKEFMRYQQKQAKWEQVAAKLTILVGTAVFTTIISIFLTVNFQVQGFLSLDSVVNGMTIFLMHSKNQFLYRMFCNSCTNGLLTCTRKRRERKYRQSMEKNKPEKPSDEQDPAEANKQNGIRIFSIPEKKNKKADSKKNKKKKKRISSLWGNNQPANQGNENEIEPASTAETLSCSVDVTMSGSLSFTDSAIV